MTDVARLTRIRIEGTARDRQELQDYLLSCVEDLCSTYGRVWEQREPVEIQTTRHGFWGRVTIMHKDVNVDMEVKRVGR